MEIKEKSEEGMKAAEQFIRTATGPIAKLSDGKWYSVNGSGPNDIMDIRYEIDLSVSWRGTPAEREAVQKAMVDAKTAELEHKTSTPCYPKIKIGIEQPNGESFVRRVNEILRMHERFIRNNVYTPEQFKEQAESIRTSIIRALDNADLYLRIDNQIKATQ